MEDNGASKTDVLIHEMAMRQPAEDDLKKAVKSISISDKEHYFIMTQKRNMLKILRRYWIMLFFYLICPFVMQAAILPAFVLWILYFRVFSRTWTRIGFSKFALFLYTGIFAVFVIILGLILRPHIYELLKKFVEDLSSITYTLFRYVFQPIK